MQVHPNPKDKNAIVTWARDLFARNTPFYILDTETTGVTADDEVIQIGIVNQLGETVLNTLLKPSVPISSGAQAVHGISQRDVANAPTFRGLYVQLSSLLAGQTVIAYNMDFDWRMIQQTAKRHQLPMIRVREKHCAMKQYAKFYGMWNGRRRSYKWQKLGNACFQQGITVGNTHDALDDVLLTLALIKAMAKGVD